MLRFKEVMACTGISESFLYELMQKNEFPRPVKIGRMSAWPASEVVAYIEGRKRLGAHP
ncbi:helix-turn-helix transcriptional regulator [Dyella humicola]|uniref:helix-turn-helix transcriptional regulator n=1 Tax=Dyella humicola TaxID=2992126 RepID=UPI00225258FA|nr:AlpA family phage regulatory protein [Dyella humicola]